MTTTRTWKRRIGRIAGRVIAKSFPGLVADEKARKQLRHELRHRVPYSRIASLGVNADCIRKVNEPASALIVTHQKAGTHLLRYLLVNYLLLLDGGREVPPATIERVEGVMPNMRAKILAGKRKWKRRFNYEKFGLSDLMFTHVSDEVLRSDEHHHLGKQIHCVRNPLDFLVSIWHYNYLQRDDPTRREAGVEDVLRFEVSKWAAQVAYMRRIAAARPSQVLSVTYEQMKSDPIVGLTSIAEFLGLPVDSELIVMAAKRGSIENVRLEEANRGRSIVANVNGYFTRDGSIGQWKRHLSAAQVERVSGIIREYGLSIEEFQIEP